MHERLGEVEPVIDGYGFSVLNERRAPITTFVYLTRDEAEKARAAMVRVLKGAISVATGTATC